MDQTIIGELNQKFKIYYPYEEISIYLRQSQLSDSPIPMFTDLFKMPEQFHPTKILFKSCHAKERFQPDEMTSLIEFKRKYPEVSYQKLELLYKKTFSLNMNGVSILSPENSVGAVSSRCAMI